MSDFFNRHTKELDLSKCWDAHAHILGVGDSDSGIHLNTPKGIKRFIHPLRVALFKKMIGLKDFETDNHYLEIMNKTAKECFEGYKVLSFSFCPFYEEVKAKKELSDFVIPNEWGLGASRKFDNLLYVTSVNPNSVTAIEDLNKAVCDGAVALKWLPCAHNINPSDKKYISFYKELAKLQLPLITHAGGEKAVQGKHFRQDFGNPLHLRLPLEHGVKVVVAHCSTEGKDIDFENGDKVTHSFELFKRLMNDKNYENNLFADISATPQINRAHWLKEILLNESWHHRLLNGSDYPLPCMPILFSLTWLRHLGLITKEESYELNKIRKENIFRFDFLIKKVVSHKGIRFPNNVFETRDFFQRKN